MPPLPGFSLEMVNVGKGDAIIVELRDQLNRGLTLVVDGGAGDKAAKVLSFLHSFHSQNVKVVVSTHSDNDHLGGLAEIVSTIRPSRVYINDPRTWEPESSIMSRAATELQPDSRNRLQSAFERINGLNEAAAGTGVTQVWWAFASATPILTWGQWNVYVVGPTRTHFNEVWHTAGNLSSLHSNDNDASVQQLESSGQSLLDDGVDTGGINNTSTMLLIEGPGQKVLLTGDGGMRAIREASAIKDITGLTILDVPHHGSRRNVDSAILAHLRPAQAYISSPGTTKHPRTDVVRKLQEVGAVVYSTCKITGTSIYQHQNLPRANYSPIQPWPLLLMPPTRTLS